MVARRTGGGSAGLRHRRDLGLARSGRPPPSIDPVWYGGCFQSPLVRHKRGRARNTVSAAQTGTFHPLAPCASVSRHHREHSGRGGRPAFARRDAERRYTFCSPSGDAVRQIGHQRLL